jgi:hypothetical protein
VQNDFGIVAIGLAGFLDVLHLMLYFLFKWWFFPRFDDVDQVLIHLRVLLDPRDIIEDQVVLEVALAGVEHKRLILH